MSEYKVIRKRDGEEVYRYQADEPIAYSGMDFATHDHVQIATEPTVTTVYGGRRLLTKLEFLRLFTATERVALRTAAKSSPPLEDYMALMELAQDINLDDADTQTGVQMLEQAGLLNTGRAQEVLNG